MSPDAPLEAARAVLASDATDWVAVVDDDGTLRGQVLEDDVDGTGPVRDRMERIEAWISVDDSLEAALAATLLTESGRVAVLDGETFLGVLTPDAIHRALRSSVGAESVPAELKSL